MEAYAVGGGDDEKAARILGVNWLGAACEEAAFGCRSD
jgi:hypothetical protein